MAVLTGGVLLAAGAERWGMLLNLPQRSGQSLTTKNHWPQMSVVLRLRKPAEDLVPGLGHGPHAQLNFTLALHWILPVSLISAPCSSSCLLSMKPCSEPCLPDSGLTLWLLPDPSPGSLLGALSTRIHKVITNLIFSIPAVRIPIASSYLQDYTTKIRTGKPAWFTASLDIAFWTADYPSQE